jgi:hypothetical protein
MQTTYFPAVFDSSMLGSYKTCPQKFFRTYIEEWKPKELSVHLHAGKAFASGLEAARTKFYVEDWSAEDSLAAGLETLVTAYGNYDPPPDSAKSRVRMAGALEYYFSEFPLEHGNGQPIILPGGKRGIEFSFAHPLPVLHPITGDPIIYCGRMDAIVSFAGGAFICDEKTTGQLGPSWSRKWDLRAQFTGYAWGCREAGIGVNGALVRGVSILKTKYETAQAVIGEGEWKIERWFGELQIWLARIIEDWKSDRYLHALDEACAEFGGCPFREVCDSQNSQQQNLETAFERRHWDPVTRVETRL